MSEPRTEFRAILSVGQTESPPQECLESLLQAMDQLVESRGGWLFRREIAGFWCAFPSLREAVRAAHQVYRQDPQGLLGLRFGLHAGDVTITPEGDVLGHVLSVAKRLETSTQSGCMLLSKEARARLEAIPEDLPIEAVAPLELKGIGHQEVCKLTFPPFCLAEILSVQDWERLRKGEVLLCLVGPLGGPEELAPLLSRWSSQGFFYEVAEERESEYGRASLVDDFRRWCQDLQPLAGLHSALGAHPLPCLAFFPDPRLGALSAPAAPGSPRAVSLAAEVLTEADLEDLWTRLPRELAGWESALTTHLIFWLGTSEWVEVFYREIRRRFPAGPGQSQFLIDPGGATPEEVLRWKKRGLKWVQGQQGLIDVLHRLHQPVTASALGPPGAQRPYRFLDSFGPTERGLFFGRERESALLRSWILTRRWLVLFGRSGVGKTSLVGAGVIPVLEESGVTVWTLRCLSDPLEQLRTRVAPETDVREGLRKFCRECARRLVIVFDQFEEFFVRLSTPQREALARFLKTVTVDPDFEKLHVLFSLREDFFAEMAWLESWIPTLLDSRFRLTPLTRDQARQSIVGPAELFHLEVEEELVEALLDELEDQGIDPPELQIVMDRLWEQRQNPDRLELGEYERAGGVRTILQDYLRASLEAESVQSQWGVDLPQQLLRSLVSPRGTRWAQTLQTLVRPLEERAEEARVLLEQLVDLRLIRKVGSGDEVYFELAHEYLIEEIQSWAGEEELAQRHARMVLMSELESWESLGSLMSPERLALIVRELPRLQPGPEEAELLVKASMVHGIPLERDDLAQASSLLRMLDEPWNGWVQRRILRELARLPLEQEAQQRFLLAIRAHSNPSLLDQLRPGLDSRFSEAVRQATRERFFGAEAMAEIPAGPAWLGSTASSRQARKQQLPAYWHSRIDSEREWQRVEMDRYWIDRTPVTNLQFAEFRPAHLDRYPDEHDHHPVVSVSWYEAQDYARWVGKQLVCELRWEKAARGEQGLLYPWGSEFDPTLLNSQEGGLRSTTEVSRYPQGASPYGCLDMAGNVWEWTASAWSDEGPFKVQKGGSTLNPAPLQMASTRQEAFPDFVLQWVGFRLMSLEAP